jgi:hypothetical protein
MHACVSVCLCTDKRASPLQFNLLQWKEYAAAKHADNTKFNSSAHGQTILQDMAQRIRTSEVSPLQLHHSACSAVTVNVMLQACAAIH